MGPYHPPLRTHNAVSKQVVDNRHKGGHDGGENMAL